MINVTFISGNQDKVDFMAKHLGFSMPHQKVDLEEIQSMDLHTISEYKARRAYSIIKKPVLVEDVGLFCDGIGGLPGPLVKWFLETIGVEGVSKLACSSSAYARVVFAYFDGDQPKFLDGEVKGRIADKPRGEGGYGWDRVFIPDGSDKTYGEMTDGELERFGLRTTTIFPLLKKFLQEIS